MAESNLSLAVKLQLIADPDDVRALKETMHAYTKACNFISACVFSSKDMNKRHIHDLYYRKLKAEFSLKAQMAESVIKTVIARY